MRANMEEIGDLFRALDPGDHGTVPFDEFVEILVATDALTILGTLCRLYAPASPTACFCARASTRTHRHSR